MSRVPWRAGKVISIETRDGIFVLAQMIQDPYIVFFNVFNDSHNWPSTELESIPVLYIAGVTRQFVSKSNVKYLKHIDACLLYTSPSPRDRQKSRMPSSA